MKRLIRAFATLAASAVLCLGFAPAALADDTGVTFKDYGEAFVFLGGSEYTATDLFDNFKGVYPGDALRQVVHVANGDPDGREVTIYLRAEAHDEQANPLSEKVAASESVASAADFLSQLRMVVRNGDAVLFDDAPHLEGGLADNVSLGTFANGESKEITVELYVPAELGNEYATRVGEVDWVFTVEEFDPVVPPSNDNLAKTGDDTPILLIGAIAVVAAFGIAIAAIVARRKRQR